MKFKRIEPGHYEGPHGITIKRCEVRRIGLANKPVKADAWWAILHDAVPTRLSYTELGAPTLAGARALANQMVTETT